MVGKTSARINARLVDDAMKILGIKSRSEAVRIALCEVVALPRFKKLMKKHAGKLKFAGHDR
jgi:Arc/MetJ family transcription regulator